MNTIKQKKSWQLDVLAFVAMALILLPITILVLMQKSEVSSKAAEVNGTTNPSFFPLAPCPSCVNPSFDVLQVSQAQGGNGGDNPEGAGGGGKDKPCKAEGKNSDGKGEGKEEENDDSISAAEYADSSYQDDKKGKKKHKKHRGMVSNISVSFLEELINLLNKLIELLGGQQIQLPNQDEPEEEEQDNPCPQGNNPPEQEQPADQPSSAPSQAASVPSVTVPSLAAAPSGAVPSIAAPSGIMSNSVPVGSKVIFDGSYDNGGFSAWGSCQWQGTNGACPAQGQAPMGAIVNDGPGHETAARFEIRPGDTAASGNRTEARAPSAADVKEGDERWYQFSLKFDQNFQNPTGGWFIVMQWHAGSGSPPLCVQVDKSGNLVLSNNTTNKSTPIGPIQKGKWVDYVLHVKFSGGANAIAESWVNGQKSAGIHKEPNMSSGSNYLKMGIYRDSKETINHVVYNDGLKITAP